LHQPARLVLELLRRARIEAALGRQEKARVDFERALTELSEVPIFQREALAAELDIARREIAEVRERAATVALRSSVASVVSQPLTTRTDFDFQRGDTAAAENDLDRILDELEKRRGTIAQEIFRVSFLDREQPTLERMVALQLNLGRPEKSLEAVERFRARALLDQLGAFGRPAITSPLGWRELCRRVPGHTVIVFYSVVDHRLVTWLVRPSGIQVPSHQPAWAAVSALVAGLSGSKSPSQASMPDILKELDRELILPWKSQLRDGDRIVFVPTDSLFEVPFGALLDPGTARFLIQDHAVSVAASASQFIAAVDRDRSLSSDPLASALLVGDPSFNTRSHPELPALPGSMLELDHLSDIYRGLETRVLRHGEATPAKVIASMGQADLVHLAVHAMADLADPTRSNLVLASGDLTAGDIARLHLPRTRLVVMAACETQAGPVSPSEGSMSLASAFLAAGVPAVVGSLWAVEDDATRRISVRLHQELRRGADPLAALRTAQLAELESVQGRSNWTWASFQLFGGVVARQPDIALRSFGR